MFTRSWARGATVGRRAALWGPVAICAGLAVQAALQWGSSGAAVAPLVLAQAVIMVLPGAVATPLIALLEAWAMRLLVLASVVAFLAAGALAAVSRRHTLPLISAPWLAGPLAALFLPAASADLLPSAASATLAAIAAWCVLAFTGTGSVAPGGRPGSERSSATPRVRATVPAPGRRRVALGLAAVTMVTALGSFALRAAGTAVRSLPGTPLQSGARPRPAAAADPSDDPALVAEARLAPDITPTGEFYVVDEAVVDPTIDPTAWRLRIEGLVRRPFSLGYAELVELPAVEQVHTLECISNDVGGSLISNAVWTGVPVRLVLERAGLADGIRKIVFTSVEGYSSGIPLEAALDPRTLLAYGMNGLTLPREHGFPARLLIPGLYGMKNVKWLTSVVATSEDHLGFWERRGWSDEAVVHTMSRIDWPPSIADLRAGVPVTVAGIAYAGARGVSRVEVSTDDRRTWQAASLGRRFSGITWRRWALRWVPPDRGWYRLSVRAYDDRGVLQPEDEQPPLPRGATGIHGYQVEAR